MVFFMENLIIVDSIYKILGFVSFDTGKIQNSDFFTREKGELHIYTMEHLL